MQVRVGVKGEREVERVRPAAVVREREREGEMMGVVA